MVEASVVLYGYEVVGFSRGSEAEVEFDFESVWEFKKRTKNFDPERLTWIHVHPKEYGNLASMQDKNCAIGFEIAFNQLGNFGIITFDNHDPLNIEGDCAWYMILNRKDIYLAAKPERISDCSMIVPEQVWYMLKAIAYSKGESNGYHEAKAARGNG